MPISKQDLKTLADAYRQGEDMIGSPEARAMINEEIKRIEEAFEALSRKIGIKFVKHDPYRTFEEMRDRVRGERQMLVWTGESDTPLWDPVVNWKARAVHDWDHIQNGLDFSMEGEAGAFRVSAARMPGLAPLYLSEIALQAAVYNYYKAFDPQKLVVPAQQRVERIVRELKGLRGLSSISKGESPLMSVWFVYGLLERGASDQEAMMHLASSGMKIGTAIQIVAAAKELHQGRKSPRSA